MVKKKYPQLLKLRGKNQYLLYSSISLGIMSYSRKKKYDLGHKGMLILLTTKTRLSLLKTSGN